MRAQPLRAADVRVAKLALFEDDIIRFVAALDEDPLGAAFPDAECRADALFEPRVQGLADAEGQRAVPAAVGYGVRVLFGRCVF